MGARSIIFEYFQNNYAETGGIDYAFYSLMDYLDTDTLVSWFVDEGYIDYIDDPEEEEIVRHHYDLHCGR